MDLTKTLAEMSQRGALRPEDVSSELIDAEIVESSCGEPDLLIVMASGPHKGRARRKSRSRASSAAGERSGEESDRGRGILAAPLGDGVSLRGYPPWQVRLTEIAWVWKTKTEGQRRADRFMQVRPGRCGCRLSGVSARPTPLRKGRNAVWAVAGVLRGSLQGYGPQSHLSGLSRCTHSLTNEYPTTVYEKLAICYVCHYEHVKSHNNAY